MAYSYNLGTVPFSGGSVNINSFNSYIKILTEETFVCVYQQNNPAAIIFGMGKCPGGFKTGTPEIVYQEVVYNFNSSLVTIEELSENRVILWNIIDNTASAFDVFELDFDNNIFERKYSIIDNTNFISSSNLFSDMQNYSGTQFNIRYVKENVVLTTHYSTSPAGTVFTKITYDEDIEELVFKRTLDTTINHSLSRNHNITIDIYRDENTDDALIYYGHLSGSSSSLGSGARQYFTHFFKTNFGGASDDLVLNRINYYNNTVAPYNQCGGTIKLDGKLYMLHGTTSNLYELEGFDENISNITSISVGKSYNISNISAHRDLIIEKIDDNYFIVIDRYSSVSTSSGNGIAIKIIRKFENLVQASVDSLLAFNNFHRNTYGYMYAMQNHIDFFDDYIVIPSRISSGLSFLVLTA